MNKTIKTIFKVIAILFIGVILYLNYQTHFSRAAREGKANLEKIKIVKTGMTNDKVFLIMGKPDTILLPDNHFQFTQYWYKTNDDSYAHVKVVLDSTMKVEETYYPR